MDFHKVIRLWTIYGFNYDSSFVERVFKNEPEWLREHLKSKFEECYRIAGMYGSFFYFWSELDSRLKTILEDWVMDNFKG